MPGLGHASEKCRFTRTVVMLFVVALLVLAPISGMAQESGDSASTPETSVDTPDSSVDAVPTDEPTADPATDTVESQPTDSPDSQAVDDATPPGESETPPPTPELSYASDAPMQCIPVSGDPGDAVSAGGRREYDFTFDIALHGRNVDPAALVIDWSVTAVTDSSWSLQLAKTPVVDESAWTPTGAHEAQLQAQLAGAPDLVSVAADDGSQETTLDGAVTIRFRMRLARPQCVADPVAFQLSRAVSVSLPGNDSATISQTGAEPDPLTFQPVQANIIPADPVVSIAAMSIDPVAFSLADQVTQGTITLQVDTAAVACQNFDVSLAIQAFTGTDVQSATTLLTATAADDATQQAVPAVDADAGLPLSELSPVAVVQTGAAAGSYTLTIVFSVVVPGQLGAGAFNVRASASVDPAAS